MRAAIDDAELKPNQIDAIFASANGSVRGDLVELRAINQLFAEGAPPVVAIKGRSGEYVGAGGLPIAAAIVALGEQALPGAGDNVELDGECSFELVRQRSETRLQNVLVNSFSAGGGIVCAVLSRS